MQILDKAVRRLQKGLLHKGWMGWEQLVSCGKRLRAASRRIVVRWRSLALAQVCVCLCVCVCVCVCVWSEPWGIDCHYVARQRASSAIFVVYESLLPIRYVCVSCRYGRWRLLDNTLAWTAKPKEVGFYFSECLFIFENSSEFLFSKINRNSLGKI